MIDLIQHIFQRGTMKTKQFAFFAAAICCAGLFASPAYASENQIIDSIQNVAPDLIINQENRTRIVLPGDTTGTIQLSNSRAIGGFAIGLPDGSQIGVLESDSSGTKYYNNNDGSITVPIPQIGGGIAINTVISSPEAPTSYRYDLTLPAGAVLTQVEDGGVIISGPSGNLISIIANPWAKDATGKDVPTRFILSDNVLIQEVDHTSGEFIYPVVADPYAGVALHGSTWWSGSGNSRKASLTTTPQMSVAWAAGQAYNYGWPEARSKMGVELNQERYRQQYKCHADNTPLVAAGGVLGYGYTWDLEYSRGTNANYLNVWAHGCNW